MEIVPLTESVLTITNYQSRLFVWNVGTRVHLKIEHTHTHMHAHTCTHTRTPTFFKYTADSGICSGKDEATSQRELETISIVPFNLP